jgi:hypothetical protein
MVLAIVCVCVFGPGNVITAANFASRFLGDILLGRSGFVRVLRPHPLWLPTAAANPVVHSRQAVVKLVMVVVR